MQILNYPPGHRLDSRSDEQLMRLAARQGPAAALWEAHQGLVVPRTYQRHAAFGQACHASAARGWPVTVRHSGGGIVPQGDGILNISLCYAQDGLPLNHAEPAYLLICSIIRDAMADVGIGCSAQAVEGSFCDGRFNLAVGSGGSARKIAGTAQLWRRIPIDRDTETHRQVVLVHAVLLLQVDCAALTGAVNRFETDLGTGARYRSDRIASLHDLRGDHAEIRHWRARLESRLVHYLQAAFS